MKIKELIKEVINEPDKLDQLEEVDFDKFIIIYYDTSKHFLSFFFKSLWNHFKKK